jgi:hypothetical protein
MANNQRFSQNKRNYYKRNFIKAVELLTPQIYITEDLDLSGTHVDPIDQVINADLKMMGVFSSVIDISSLPNTIYSSMSNISGISPFFVKQNDIVNITPFEFEARILAPLNRSFNDFRSSAAFADYLSGTLLSTIVLNYPTADVAEDAVPSSTHKHLIDHLNWYYFLNTSGPLGGLAFEPSTLVLNRFVDKLYSGKSITIDHAMEDLHEYVYRNYETCSAWNASGLLPPNYEPSSLIVGGDDYVSGLEPLSRLKTLLNVIYSPLYINLPDTRVRDSIQDYIEGSGLLNTLESAGPFVRLLKAFSFSFADINNTVDELNTLKDIEQCPDNFLPLLADLIGWPLFGSDPDRWRLQLQNAVGVYKAAGTKNSIQIALNNVFAEGNLDVSSQIHELWESYIPHLIYYALGTESTILKDFSTWTRDIARGLGVSGYSTSAMDINLRMSVDAIILALVERFPEAFKMAGEPFPLGSSSFVFNFRNRVFPIPPWEEYPYYIPTDLSKDMVDVIVDKLVCFGVRQDFAEDVGTYITSNTLSATDDIRAGNGWLMFTSGVSYPTNWDIVLDSISDKRSSFLPLWSGKSSHYKLFLNAADFDFTKRIQNFDSPHAVRIIGQVTNEFSPAHAIPSILLQLSAVDDQLYEDFNRMYVRPQVRETWLNYASGAAVTNSELSGASFNGYKRRLNVGGNVMGRENPNSVVDFGFSSTADDKVFRNAFRRRSYENIYPSFGMYTRTGFNMPIGWYMRMPENSYASSLGFLPLGYIPSANTFLSIPDPFNLPTVYSRCTTIASPSSFSGVDASNTYPCRGLSAVVSSDHYVDRCQLDPFIAAVHWIQENKAYLSGVQLVENRLINDPSSIVSSLIWKDVARSWANSGISVSAYGFDSQEEFYKYKFGREFMKLYTEYTSNFHRHVLRPDLHELEGPLIWAHVFGSILRNSKFDKYGSTVATLPNLVASSPNDVRVMRPGDAIFSTSGITPYGTYVASNTADLRAESNEFRSSTILDAVQIVHTSGSSPDNSFSIYKIGPSVRIPNSNTFVRENPMIKMQAINGLPRLKYDLQSFSFPANETDGFSSVSNFFTPDKEFEFTIRGLIGQNNGLRLGGASIGVWIHTDDENGHVWSYTPEGKWRMDKSTSINKEHILGLLTHKFFVPERGREIPSGSGSGRSNPFECIDFIDQSRPNNQAIILSFREDEFENFTVKFNTNNKPIRNPETYYGGYGNVHQLNRNYNVEVFMLPNTANRDKFLLVDFVNLVNQTYNEWARPFVTGKSTGLPIDPYCDKKRVEMTRERLTDIYRYFNFIAGVTNYQTPFASRNANQTESLFGTSGGSKLDYRINPEWAETITKDAAQGYVVVHLRN